MTRKIFVIAGEASGDLHGASLIRALREAEPGLEIHGVGGDKIRETGALDFVDLAHFHVTGLTEVLKQLPKYRAAARRILASIDTTKPDGVVLIDNPGFNLHLAEKLAARGVPVVYYIAPQVWAWAPKRVLKMKRTVKKVLVVFDFERKLFEENGVPVSWVGHPLRDLIPESPRRPFDPSHPRVALLPGSRRGELKGLLESFLEAARVVKRKIPGTTFALVKAPTLPRELYAAAASEPGVEWVEHDAYAAIGGADLAIACSGTVTLECAMLGTPPVITNRVSPVTYEIAKRLIRVKYIGLPNLILDAPKFPELIQADATGEKLGNVAASILSDPARLASMRADLAEVSRRLGGPGASERAAREILSTL